MSRIRAAHSRGGEERKAAGAEATLGTAGASQDHWAGADRREFLQGAAATAAALALPRWARADSGDLGAIRAEVEKRHAEAVERL